MPFRVGGRVGRYRIRAVLGKSNRGGRSGNGGGVVVAGDGDDDVLGVGVGGGDGEGDGDVLAVVEGVGVRIVVVEAIGPDAVGGDGEGAVGAGGILGDDGGVGVVLVGDGQGAGCGIGGAIVLGHRPGQVAAEDGYVVHVGHGDGDGQRCRIAAVAEVKCYLVVVVVVAVGGNLVVRRSREVQLGSDRGGAAAGVGKGESADVDSSQVQDRDGIAGVRVGDRVGLDRRRAVFRVINRCQSGHRGIVIVHAGDGDGDVQVCRIAAVAAGQRYLVYVVAAAVGGRLVVRRVDEVQLSSDGAIGVVGGGKGELAGVVSTQVQDRDGPTGVRVGDRVGRDRRRAVFRVINRCQSGHRGGHSQRRGGHGAFEAVSGTAYRAHRKGVRGAVGQAGRGVGGGGRTAAGDVGPVSVRARACFFSILVFGDHGVVRIVPGQHYLTVAWGGIEVRRGGRDESVP